MNACFFAAVNVTSSIHRVQDKPAVLIRSVAILRQLGADPAKLRYLFSFTGTLR